MLPPIGAGASRDVSIVRRMAIRSYRPGDRAAVYDICLRTGDAGADASDLVSDPDLPGHVYAGPYVELCPELAFVLDLGGAVSGYVIGALDTGAFVDAYRERWLPRVAGSHPPPAGPPATHEERLLDALHRPELMLTPRFPEHPSHLHVNLLPVAQGRGHGRALIETVCGALRAAGSPGVHLGVRRRNERALGFYARAGFDRLHEDPDAVFFGRTLGTS
jgi:ribosomal protein S18 acetylase RimI-like enzyme